MKKILVVDDEEVIREGMRRILSAEGYQVETSASGRSAIEKIQEHDFDVVITDLKMENVSGMDILKEVNRLHPETRVIMLTAYATLDATIEAIRERIYDFFPKPVKIDELKKSVKKALGD